MKNLYKILPPFAPDYSGVCSVLFELGGIIIIGIPYITGVPIGEKASLNFYKAVKGMIAGKKKETNVFLENKMTNSNIKALIVGEQIMSNSLRKFFEQDMGLKKTVVASYFKMDEELKEADDKYLKEEDSLNLLVEKGNFNLIIGDPLYKDLLSDDLKQRYINLPHVAVSSRLYWDNEINYVGEKANREWCNYL